MTPSVGFNSSHLWVLGSLVSVSIATLVVIEIATRGSLSNSKSHTTSSKRRHVRGSRRSRSKKGQKPSSAVIETFDLGPDSAENAKLPLVKLVPELVDLIASHLPPCSAVSMTLSCRAIRRKLGDRYIRVIQRDGRPTSYSTLVRDWDISIPRLSTAQAERQEFLYLLERDNRHLAVCSYCQKLHEPTREERAICDGHDADQYLSRIWEKQFYRAAGFTHTYCFWMMRRVRDGLDVSASIEKLSTTTRTVQEQEWLHDQVFHASIISGRLFLRVRQQILFAKGLHKCRYRDGFRLPSSGPWIRICHHYFVSSPVFYGHTDSELGQLLFCKLSHNLGEKDCPKCCGVHQCEECKTEFELDVADFRRYRSGLVVTVWHDFGECRVPNDPDWWNHFRFNPLNPPPRIFVPGSIRAMIEENEHA